MKRKNKSDDVRKQKVTASEVLSGGSGDPDYHVLWCMACLQQSTPVCVVYRSQPHGLGTQGQGALT